MIRKILIYILFPYSVCGQTIDTCSELISIDSLFKDKNTVSYRFENADVICMGEIHGRIEGFLGLKYLHNQISSFSNVKYISLEISPSFAYLINQYLKNGDSSLIYSILQKYKYKYSDFKELYNYNKTLSLNKKIVVIGIDYEYFDYDVVDLIEQFFFPLVRDIESSKMEHIIGSLCDRNGNCRRLTDKRSLKIIKLLNQDMLENIQIYKHKFGSFFFLYEDIINSSLSELKSKSFRDREDFMYKKINMYASKLENHDVILSLIGMIHISKYFQKEWIFKKNWTSLVSSLNKNNKNLNIISIAIYYDNFMFSEEVYDPIVNINLQKYKKTNESYIIYNKCLKTDFPIDFIYLVSQ